MYLVIFVCFPVTIPNAPNSNVVAHFTHGHQGDTKNGDMTLGFRAASARLIVKGLLEIY